MKEFLEETIVLKHIKLRNSFKSSRTEIEAKFDRRNARPELNKFVA